MQWWPKFTPDSGSVLYEADQNVDGVTELFSNGVRVGVARRINGPLPGGGVKGFDITPDGKQVIFVASQDTADVYELYKSWLPGLSGQEIFLLLLGE